MKQQMQKGFTLIELMIVVAIIAILAAVAIPAYSDYVKKTKVGGSIAEAAGIKTAASEYHASNGSFAAALTDLGYASTVTSIAGQDATLTYASGVITLTFPAGEIESGTTQSVVKLTAVAGTGNLKWVCESTNTSAAYLPTSCSKVTAFTAAAS